MSSRLKRGRVTAGERAARWGHRGGVLELDGPGDADRRHRALALRRRSRSRSASMPTSLAFARSARSARSVHAICRPNRACSFCWPRSRDSDELTARMSMTANWFSSDRRSNALPSRRCISCCTSAGDLYLDTEGAGLVMSTAEINAEVERKAGRRCAPRCAREVTGTRRRLPHVQLSGRRRAAHQAGHRARSANIPVLLSRYRLSLSRDL